MKLRTTLIMAATAVALIGAVVIYDQYAPTTAEAYNDSALLVRFAPAEIDGITITNNEERIELRGERGVWRMTEPLRDLVDPTLVVQLLNVLAGTAKLEQIDPHSPQSPSLRELGLTKSALRIQLHGKHAPPEITFGKDTVLEDRLYVRLGDEDAAYVIGDNIKSLVTKKADDFRDRRLLSIDPTYVRRLVVSTASGEIDAEKKDDEWTLSKPLKTAADAKRVNELLSQLATTRITTFVPENAAPTAGGFGEARGKVTIYPGSSGKPITLAIGQPVDGETVLTKLDSREGTLLALPKAIENFLTLKPADLRSHDLLPVLFDEVDRFTISDASGTKTVLARNEESWVLKNVGGRAANTTAVRQLIEKLQHEQIVNFVDDAGADLAKYGLDKPARTIAFSSYSSGNTPESTAGEHPLLTLLLGKSENGLVYAKTDAAPFIFTVTARLLEDLPADPVQWQETALFHFQPEQITAVEVTPPSNTALVFQRDGTTWKATSAVDSLNSNAVTSLVNTLANLHAVRWVGSVVPAGAFSGPIWQFKFTLSDGTTQQITTGATTPAQMTYAMGKGANGVFLLSKPDVQALQAPLVNASSPTPLPLASPQP